MLEKDFDAWNLYKKDLQNFRKQKNFRVGEVWYCSIGINIGRELDGKNKYFERPILIIKKFNDEMFWAIPLTSKPKEGRYYHTFYYKGVRETAILSQLLRSDIGRLQRMIFRLAEEDVDIIRDRIKQLL